MNDDPLFEATRALREIAEVKSDVTRPTRAKVLSAVRQRRHSRARRSWFAIPLAALAMGSVAMAATRGYLPAPMQLWVEQVTGLAPKVTRGKKSAAAHSKPANTAPTMTVPTPLAPLPEPSALPIVPLPTSAEATPASVAPATSSPTGDRVHENLTDSPMTEAEFQRYRLAHDAHFVAKDPAEALRLWNDYLAHAPSGRLAVEARYNRALCLLKLGRTAEAKRALAPFVAGTYGAYRKQDVRALIATIDTDAGQ